MEIHIRSAPAIDESKTKSEQLCTSRLGQMICPFFYFRFSKGLSPEIFFEFVMVIFGCYSI